MKGKFCADKRIKLVLRRKEQQILGKIVTRLKVFLNMMSFKEHAKQAYLEIHCKRQVHRVLHVDKSQ
jgi:hypothetical protein